MDSNVTMLQPLSCDNHFGPAATAWDRPRFDFTVAFEQSILSIGPYTALLLAALPRLYVLQKKTRKVKDHSLSRAKQVCHCTTTLNKWAPTNNANKPLPRPQVSYLLGFSLVSSYLGASTTALWLPSSVWLLLRLASLPLLSSAR